MVEAEKREFAERIRAVFDVYGKQASKEVLQVWWAALEGFSLQEVSHGLTRYVRSPDSGSFPPKPADIIRMIEGTSGDRGVVAWSKVLETIHRVGQYGSVAFDDPIIHAVIEDMGGWTKLCTQQADEMPFRAAEFAKKYRSYAERGLDRYTGYLMGTHEYNNRMAGFEPAPPVLIGDPEKAKQVLALGQSAPQLRITRIKSLSEMLPQLQKPKTQEE